VIVSQGELYHCPSVCHIWRSSEVLSGARTTLVFCSAGSSGLFLFSALGVATVAETVESGLGHPLTLFCLSLSLPLAAFVQVELNRRVGKGRSLLLTLTAGVLTGLDQL
jgi:hypothetical protein